MLGFPGTLDARKGHGRARSRDASNIPGGSCHWASVQRILAPGAPAWFKRSSLDRAIPAAACALGLRAGDVEGCTLRCDMSMSRSRPPQTSSNWPQPRPMTESEFHFHRRSRSWRGSFACACPPESVCPCPWAKPRGRNVCGDLDLRIVWYRFSLGPGPRGGKANAYYFNSPSRVRVRRRAGPSVRHV